MAYSELSEKNYKRISLINWVLAPAMLIVFAWPYHLLCRLLDFNELLAFSGSLLFAAPFMMTVLHGHVTMALGAMHRHLYYDWISRRPLTHGFFFHPVFFLTRFRLTLLLISLIFLPVGYFLV
ncbi:MAG: hypothetical protein WD266_01690 [Balneolales bacterium]